jgi:hypothetical protein
LLQSVAVQKRAKDGSLCGETQKKKKNSCIKKT